MNMLFVLITALLFVGLVIVLLVNDYVMPHICKRLFLAHELESIKVMLQIYMIEAHQFTESDSKFISNSYISSLSRTIAHKSDSYTNRALIISSILNDEVNKIIEYNPAFGNIKYYRHLKCLGKNNVTEIPDMFDIVLSLAMKDFDDIHGL